MPFIFVLILNIIFIITPAWAIEETAYFDVNNGILTLPKVNVMPQGKTWAVELQQIQGGNGLIFELSDIYPVSSTRSTSSYYDLLKGRLYVPTVKVDTTFYSIELALVDPPTLPPRYSLSYYDLLTTEVTTDTVMAKTTDLTAVPSSSPNTAYKIPKGIVADLETQPVPADGDAADDPAIWLHPDDPAQSLIIGTQKKGGLIVYDLTGREMQYITDGRINNVDLRYAFKRAGTSVAVVAASHRDHNSIVLYKVDPVTRQLEGVAARMIEVGLQDGIYGLCMYHSASSDQYYVFVNDKSGAIEQWQLFDSPQGIDAKRVRRLKVSSQPEGCVADDALGLFYLGEEDVGIWQFAAEPDGTDDPILIDSTTQSGYITADVEGLALYEIDQEKGYLIASSQGDSTFIVYERAAPHRYLGSFKITTNTALNIDGVTDTDGIEVTSAPLSKAFPAGILVVQDGNNTDPNANQNFKIISWEKIAKQLNLSR